MKQENQIVLLNDDTENPLYRLLIQTSDELPAHDIGLDKIQYKQEAIEAGLKGLVGGYVYDETRSNHNRKTSPNMRGRKVAKMVSKGYNPTYGGYVDIEPFDNEFITTLNQAIDNKERGLPVNEGPSTELEALDGERYGDNSLLVTDLNYTGDIAWVNKPRESRAGVCRVIENSIRNIMEEDDTMTENEIKLTKEDYDTLISKGQELDELQTKYSEGLELYNQGKEKYEALIKEKEDLAKEEADLRTQLLPVWNRAGEKKTEMVNSILETIPEKERDSKRETFESMTSDQLGVIINTLPTQGDGQRGITNGGAGSGRPPAPNPDKVFEDPEKQKQWEDAQKLPSTQSRRGVGIIASTIKEE